MAGVPASKSRSCAHCHRKITDASCAIEHTGFVYHADCYKCYVCGNSYLQGGEVFKGVLFCSSCANRIFRQSRVSLTQMASCSLLNEELSVRARTRSASSVHLSSVSAGIERRREQASERQLAQYTYCPTSISIQAAPSCIAPPAAPPVPAPLRRPALNVKPGAKCMDPDGQTQTKLKSQDRITFTRIAAYPYQMLKRHVFKSSSEKRFKRMKPNQCSSEPPPVKMKQHARHKHGRKADGRQHKPAMPAGGGGGGGAQLQGADKAGVQVLYRPSVARGQQRRNRERRAQMEARRAQRRATHEGGEGGSSSIERARRRKRVDPKYHRHRAERARANSTPKQATSKAQPRFSLVAFLAPSCFKSVIHRMRVH